MFQQWRAFRRRDAFARHSREGGNPSSSDGALSAGVMPLLVIPAEAGIHPSERRAFRRRDAFARHSRGGGNPSFSNGTLSAREMPLLVIPAKAGIHPSAMARFPPA